MNKEEIIDCPFCENSEEGCCACDHTGKVYARDFIVKESDDFERAFNDYLKQRKGS